MNKRNHRATVIKIAWIGGETSQINGTEQKIYKFVPIFLLACEKSVACLIIGEIQITR